MSSSEGYSSPVEPRGGIGGWFGRSRRRHDGPPPGFVPNFPPGGIPEEGQEAGPPIEFDRLSRLYSGFTLTSPDTILYKNKLYPTAMHLLEAHKFLGPRNDLAERVRNTSGMAELQEVVNDLASYARSDWDQAVLDKLDDVLHRKFVQHMELRNLLLNTGFSEIIYRDPSDLFWGSGPSGEGENNLGKALMSVRERLRRDMSGRY
ncbi:hypothetical protein SCHPADRAFT_835983 [Schizopora paradoxa]|uniref:NADAR domain-containing protein n=1 Tax=Schizopora paradoxa TaxID=27342 RepID=A0A0H2R7W8_9AGAM|nr:hypothetical protein SCHPADRAFT_835983 [Schizopora paradoxa]